ncbi:unnamed protein product [Adineta ricciae]|uniref:RNA helicase n=1 Tax=Adineta ricciae TaxID=249248 RepID=A0A815MCB2_ADIRI|nr:unnamed protein product [Adineta ricciae]
MVSTTVNNNTTSPPSPSAQSSTNGSKPGLASLANAKEPGNSPTNQQQPAVGTFPQRTSGGPSTIHNASPFGTSFGQGFSFNQPSAMTNFPTMSAPNQPSGNSASFSFNTTAAGTTPNFSFNPTAATGPANPPRFSFSNINPGLPPSSNVNSSTSNSQAQQPTPSFMFTPSAQQQDKSNNQKSPPQQTTQNNMPTGYKQGAVAQTSIAQHPQAVDQDDDNLAASIAESSLLSKMVNTKLRDTTDVVVDRSDPTSPLYSTKSFEELKLKPELLKGIYNMGFTAPSKIQETALPYMLNNPPKNMIAQSQSGTGKTVSFSIAMLSRIDPSIPSVQALVLVPTFELAVQIGSVVERLAQFLPYIQIAYAVRDENLSKRRNRVRNQLIEESVVIGTPGTIEEWCGRLRIIDLKKLRVFVVDEADVMIATQGFRANCVNLVNGINSSTCQMLLFSATYSDEVMEFAREIVQQPVVLRLKREKQTLYNIRQYYINCADAEEKYRVIERIYACLDVGQTVIFCRTKRTAHELAVRMANQNHSVRQLTGDLEIEVRAAVIKQFRDGLFRVLISTNVTSRGIDIDDVSLVINYDMPVTQDYQPDYETYLHRIGRCGRFGRTGYTFNLIGSESDFNIMQAIEIYFQHTIDQITIDDINNLVTDV